MSKLVGNRRWGQTVIPVPSPVVEINAGRTGRSMGQRGIPWIEFGVVEGHKFHSYPLDNPVPPNGSYGYEICTFPLKFTSTLMPSQRILERSEEAQMATIETKDRNEIISYALARSRCSLSAY